ncbi:MAG: sugar transferase [Microthrixaceae bacterium]
MISRWLSIRLVFDRILAVVAGIAVAPAVAVLAMLVRRHDGSRGLIKVKRVGRDGKMFDMWKIRSMSVQSDDGRAGGAALTASADNRVTPIGRKIRALHLDELPQIYNVAKGQMALLGPRPEAPEFVDIDDAMWREVLSVPPGIAGPTQIIVGDWEKTVIDQDEAGGAYMRDVVPVKLAIDRWYVTKASPAGDLRVLSSLIVNALGREARGLKRAVGRAVSESAAAIGPTVDGSSR